MTKVKENSEPTFEEISKFQKTILNMGYLVGWYTCEELIKRGEDQEYLEDLKKKK